MHIAISIKSAHSSKNFSTPFFPSRYSVNNAEGLVAVSIRRFIVKTPHFNSSNSGNNKMQQGSLSIYDSFDTCKVELNL